MTWSAAFPALELTAFYFLLNVYVFFPTAGDSTAKRLEEGRSGHYQQTETAQESKTRLHFTSKAAQDSA